MNVVFYTGLGLNLFYNSSIHLHHLSSSSSCFRISVRRSFFATGSSTSGRESLGERMTSSIAEKVKGKVHSFVCWWRENDCGTNKQLRFYQ